MNILTGHRTKIGGYLAILGGIAQIGVALLAYLSGSGTPQDMSAVTTGWAAISGGFIAIGLGGKAERIAQASEAAKPTTPTP